MVGFHSIMDTVREPVPFEEVLGVLEDDPSIRVRDAGCSAECRLLIRTVSLPVSESSDSVWTSSGASPSSVGSIEAEGCLEAATVNLVMFCFYKWLQL